ncbi:hypothetical protein XarjCFBP7645_11175 [Xanthomonas arboricola]|uniref:Uncharacterized protein n=1 Tax=Xanthomonas arboricola TaxID=56448 RepID=A0A2S7AEF3_9XANT|nr:hypothetical protein XarjCFBP7645_11175 [Xanthomonas arboricola]
MVMVIDVVTPAITVWISLEKQFRIFLQIFYFIYIKPIARHQLNQPCDQTAIHDRNGDLMKKSFASTLRKPIEPTKTHWHFDF